MELWAAGIALLIIAAGILVLILCRKKIHKGLRIFGVCVLGALFAAILGYIVLTFLFLDALDSPSMDEPTVSRTVLSEEQATCFWTHWILLPWMSLRFPEQCYLRNRLH